MDRQTQFIGIALGAGLMLAGCANSRSSKVRETAAPDALNIHADAPSLLPAMPVATTGTTRGQVPETPPNTVLISLAMFLSLFIMMPTITASYEQGLKPLMNEEVTEMEGFQKAVVPFKQFMLKARMFTHLTTADQTA